MISKYNLIILQLFLLLFPLSILANTTVDSLTQVLKDDISDSVRAETNYSIYRYLKYEDIEEARKHALASLEISRKTGYKKYEGKSLRALGILYFTQHKLDSARCYFIKAQKVFENIHDSLFIGYLYNDIGSTYPKYGSTDIKIEYFLKAHSMIKKYKKNVSEVTVLYNIGLEYFNAENYKQALEYLYKALKLSEKNNLEQNESLLYTLGFYYYRFKLYDKAKNMLNRTLRAAKETNNKVYEYYTFGTLFYLYMNEQKYDSAAYYLQKSLKHKNEPYYTDFRDKVKFSRYYLWVDSLDLAYEYIMLAEKTNDFNNENNLEYGQSSPTRFTHQENKSMYYRKRNLPRKSLEALLEIKEDSLIRFEDKLNLHSEYSKVYYQLGNTEKAYKHLLLANQWNDSLNTVNNRQMIIEKDLIYKHEREKDEQESILKQKRLEKELELSDEKRLNLLLSTGILFILVITVIVYLNLRRKRKDNKLLLEQKLAIEKKEELTASLLRELNHRVKNNLQMVSSLFTMQRYDTSDTKVQEALQKASGRIDSLAILHQHMYKRNYLAGPGTKQYLTDLCIKIIDATGIEDKLNLQMSFEDISLDVGKMTHIGLITNELLTNAIKYGVDINRNDNDIELSFIKDSDKYILNISNTNYNYTNPDINANSSMLGLKLAQTIAQQYKGNVIATFEEKANVKAIMFL